MIKKGWMVILLVIIISLFYKDLLFTFYQQDEWYGLGEVLVHGSKSLVLHTDFIKILLGQGRVLSNLLVYLFFTYFTFSVKASVLLAIGLHIVNTVLVFYLSKKSWIATALFAFNATASGALTWPMAATGTLPATTLILLSLFTFFKFLESQHKIDILLTFGLVYLSLFFKEIGVFLFILYPLWYIYIKRPKLQKLLANFSIFLVFGLLIVLFRVGEFRAIPVQQDLFLTGSQKNFVSTLVFRSMAYPLTSLSLGYFPPDKTFEFAKKITWNYYNFFPSSIYDLVAQSVVIDMLAISITLIILFMSWRMRATWFWLVFSLTSFLPYIIISKSGAFLESRYYYVASIAGSVLAGLLFERFWQAQKYTKFVVLSILLIMLGAHLHTITVEIARQKNLSSERLSLLNQLLSIKNHLDPKQVFYLTSDRGFYITTGNPVPMQQGMGYTILVWYFAHRKAPTQALNLIKEHFLWELNGQGFREDGGFGYGYFWDEAQLKVAINTYHIEEKNILHLYYDSQQKQLKQI